MYMYKKWICLSFVLFVFLGYCAIFEWRVVSVPVDEKGPCFSPNHAFYIKRYQTLWESLGIRYGSDLGTARLYDRSNKLLYEGETYVKGGFGPEWVAGSKGDSSNPPIVFYQGTKEPGWRFALPESPGSGESNKNCYPSKID